MLQKVVRSTIIDAPIERVWAVLRDFNSHDQWHAVVAESRIEGGESPTQVGCIRNFTLADGNHIREQLIGLSDTEHTSTYCIVEASVPLQRYVSTVTLKPVTDGNRTFWHWTSSFDTPPGMERELHDMVAQGVYEAGFDNLRRHLVGGGDGPRRTRTDTTAVAGPMACREVRVQRHGGAEQLEAVDAQARGPGPGEVRIRQRAIGVNFFDIYLRRGWMPDLLGPQGVPGMEAAGTVVDVGDGVAGLLPGDRVAYLCPEPGAYRSVRTLPARHVLRLPQAVEDDTAAALLLKGVTADLLLRDVGRVRAGTRMLVHGAAGGLGLVLCSWARALGANVMGTVSSEAKARVAREHGCEQIVVTSEHRFADAVQRHFDGGAELVVDGLGEAAREENFAALARRGHWVSLGQASGPLAPIDPGWLVQKSLSFSRPVVFDYVDTPNRLAERAARVWDALAGGQLRAPTIERFTLDAAGRAHERLESRASIGALVLSA